MEAVKLKQMGVRSGVPDLFLPVAKGCYNGLYIEMKYGQGRLRDNQKEYMAMVMKQGYCCYVCYSAENAIDVLSEYINLSPIDTGAGENRMNLGNGIILKEGKVKNL